MLTFFSASRIYERIPELLDVPTRNTWEMLDHGALSARDIKELVAEYRFDVVTRWILLSTSLFTAMFIVSIILRGLSTMNLFIIVCMSFVCVTHWRGFRAERWPRLHMAVHRLELLNWMHTTWVQQWHPFEDGQEPFEEDLPLKE